MIRRPVPVAPRKVHPPLTGAELDAIECAIRSGIAPSLETAGRMLADLKGLRDAMRWDARRRELYEPGGGS